jgi:SAM-dependent methyltransferase
MSLGPTRKTEPSEAYAGQLAVARELRLAGRSFREIQRALLARFTAISLAKPQVKASERYGLETLTRAYFGKNIPVKAGLSWPFHDLTVMDAIRSAMPPDTETVVDIGCGDGRYLAELAERDLTRQYFGAEISQSGLDCLTELALCLGQANIAPVKFDIRAPDFGFVPKSNVFAYSVAALVYSPVGEDFFRRLFARSTRCKCLLLEPISYQIPSVDSALFTRPQADSMGQFHGLYGTLKALRNSGEIRIERVVPDYTGSTAVATYTLIEFSAT